MAPPLGVHCGRQHQRIDLGGATGQRRLDGDPEFVATAALEQGHDRFGGGIGGQHDAVLAGQQHRAGKALEGTTGREQAEVDRLPDGALVVLLGGFGGGKPSHVDPGPPCRLLSSSQPRIPRPDLIRA